MANTKRRTATTQQRSNQKPYQSSGFLSILLSFFIGYAIAHVFDINFVGGQLDHLLHQASKTPKQTGNQTAKMLPKPKFEYYALLKKEGHSQESTIKTTPHPSQITVTQGKPLSPLKSDDRQYLLQLASYFKKDDAERVKAELILQGHQASIQTHKTENRTIYRLMIGPFKHKTEAEKEQVNLAKQLHVMGMIRQTRLS